MQPVKKYATRRHQGDGCEPGSPDQDENHFVESAYASTGKFLIAFRRIGGTPESRMVIAVNRRTLVVEYAEVTLVLYSW